jgi:peptidyl-prolyl cis-trans isomerase D
MLQNIRKNIQGTMAKVVVAIIIVPFALFGIESLIGGSGVQSVAEVNGEAISAQDLQQEINQQKRRLLTSMGDEVDPSMLDDQVLSGPTLEMMIQKALLRQAAGDYGLAVSEQQVGSVIGSIEAFQVGGRFDPQLFRQVLSDQGFSPGGFQRSLQDDLLMNQLRSGLAGSEFATPAEVDAVAAIVDESRDLRYLVMPLETFRDAVAVDEARLEAWYAEHQQRFMSEESVDVEYIELTLDDFRAPVDEAELMEAYELEKDNFVLPEQRGVSHILFEQADGESEEALLGRIEEVQALIDGGQDFATLAGEYSQDVGSAAVGGDLGFTSGDSFPAEIEEVIAGLTLGAVSAPVESDAGWHLFKVTEIRDGGVDDFESVRAQLEQQIGEDRARRDLIQKVERLRDLAFNAEDLAGPAGDLELEVETAKQVTRDQGSGLFSNAQLIAAAFGSEVLNDRFNSPVIELSDGHFVVLRVTEYREPKAQPMAAVRSQVIAAVEQEQARELISARADELLAEARGGASIESLAQASGYEWQVELAARRDSRTVPSSLLRRAFQLAAPAPGTSSHDYVVSPEGDVQLFQLVRVTPGQPGNMNKVRRDSLQQGLAGEYMRAVDTQFQQTLRESADVAKI